MDINKKTILAFPRSGTKSLADIFQRNGYHNFGEFFNTFNCTIDNSGSVPCASRMAITQQQKILKTRATRGINLDNYTQTLIVQNRYKKFLEYKDVSPSVIVLSNSGFDYVPEVSSLLSDRQVLCLRRDNRFDQLLSRCITMIFLNYDNEYKSYPTKIDKAYFEFNFHSLVKLEKMQDRCVDNGNGIYIDFDQMIQGTANLGFDYHVTSDDQHRDLKSLVINIIEITEIYNSLIKSYNLDWNSV